LCALFFTEIAICWSNLTLTEAFKFGGMIFMDGVTPLLALTDFIPVFLFGIGAIFFLRVSYQMLGPFHYTAMAGGAVLCFVGGFFKAISKLLEATFDTCIPALQTSQFVMLAPGFLLLFIASMGFFAKKNKSLMSVAPVVMETWKIPFIAIMTLSNIGFLVVMSVFSIKLKTKLPAVMYSLSIILLLLMPYLSTKEFTTQIHWIAQSINSVVQLFAMIGHISLYKGFTKESSKKNLSEIL